MNNHKPYMKRCLELAKTAAKEGESAVGSIIVKNGVILGEAYEKSRQLKDVTRHAEVLTILDALKHNDNLIGSTLYTNIEPCILCSYAIRHHGIAEVVFSKHSGELGGTQSPFNLLSSNHFKSWNSPPKIILYKDQ